MERRLSAILAADVVGYSAKMEADEAGTFARLTARRKELFEPEITKHHGRIFKLMGDGLLTEFGSVVDAVECAVTLQRGMVERNASLADDQHIEIRIGINLGEVIVDGEDRYGEGVNVAARLQQLADPGDILVSGKVSKEVEKKLAFGFEPVGEHRLKNITEPVVCYRVNLQTGSSAPQCQMRSTVSRVPTKASIAILPFNNMSSESEQEYFVDGLVEDLITDLSKVSGLFVISRNSAFAYKGKFVDVRLVAKDLGVRYVVEGSVRRAASRIRINVQLIDAADGTHLWADRFDRDLADVFVLQDEVVAKIVGAFSEVLPTPVLHPSRKATSIEAYDFFVRGRSLVNQSVQIKTARLLLQKAIDLDPGFAEAYAWLAVTHQLGWLYCGEPIDQHRTLSRQAAEKAVSLEPENTEAHLVLGYLGAYDGELIKGINELKMALRINPNHAEGWALLADLKVFEGRPLESIEAAQKAFHLNPYPSGDYYWLLGWGQYAAGSYENAVETLRHETATGSGVKRVLAAALAQLGRMAEANEAARQFLLEHPYFSARAWGQTQPFLHEADRQHFVKGYVKAGLPE